MKPTKGFTLIELVVVIVILGILAATALPKFVNLGKDARIAAVNGLAASIRSATAMFQGKCQVSTVTRAAHIVNGNGVTVSWITNFSAPFNGSTVTYAGLNCYPEAGWTNTGTASPGFIETLVDYDANVFELTLPNGSLTTRFRVKGAGDSSNTCYVEYSQTNDANTPPEIKIDTSGC